MSATSHIIAVKAAFDGQQIVLPEEVRGLAPGNVIVIFEAEAAGAESREQWMKAQEPAFAKAWSNSEDEVYDQL